MRAFLSLNDGLKGVNHERRYSHDWWLEILEKGSHIHLDFGFSQIIDRGCLGEVFVK